MQDQRERERKGRRDTKLIQTHPQTPTNSFHPYNYSTISFTRVKHQDLKHGMYL